MRYYMREKQGFWYIFHHGKIVDWYRTQKDAEQFIIDKSGDTQNLTKEEDHEKTQCSKTGRDPHFSYS